MTGNYGDFFQNLRKLFQNFLQIPAFFLGDFCRDSMDSGSVERNIITFWLYDIVLVFYKISIFIV